MKIAAQDATKARRSRSTEAVILFCIGTQTFAIAADAVQEIRSTDSQATAAIEMELAEVPKVRHLVERSHRTYYVVSGCAHFGLRATRPTLVLTCAKFALRCSWIPSKEWRKFPSCTPCRKPFKVRSATGIAASPTSKTASSR